MKKRDNFFCSIVRMPEKSNNIPSNIFYMSIIAECLRIARACYNQNSFSDSVNPLVMRMILQGAKKCRIAGTLLNSFNKHKRGANCVTKTGNKLLAIV